MRYKTSNLKWVSLKWKPKKNCRLESKRNLNTFAGKLYSEKYFVDVKIVCNEKTFACDKAIQWQWIKKKLGWIATFSDVQCGKLRWSEKERKKNVTFEDSTMSTLEMMIERIRKLPKGRIFKNLCRKEIGSDISFDLDNS